MAIFQNTNLLICRANEVVSIVNWAQNSGAAIDGVISLEHPGAEKISAYLGHAPRLSDHIGHEWAKKQLLLTCYDVEDDRFGVPPPLANIVEDALAFVDGLPLTHFSRMNLIVHCRSGKARSTALGLVIALHRDGRPKNVEDYVAELVEMRDIAGPNLAIIQHGDNILGYHGRLVEAVLAHEGITVAREESDRRRAHQVESRRATPAP